MNGQEPSLLSHLNQVRSQELSSSETTSVSLVIYCGLYQNIDANLVLSSQREVVEEEVNNNNSNITGILMAQGNSIFHMLEGPSEAVLRILKLLTEQNQFVKGDQQGRIVLSLEDRKSRNFPEWYVNRL